MFFIRLQSSQCNHQINRTQLLLSLSCVLFNLLTVFKQVECLQIINNNQAQQLQNSSSNSTSGSNNSSASIDATAVLLAKLSESNTDNSSDVTLLSSEEYVDAKEVPAILIDDVLNDTSSSTHDDEHDHANHAGAITTFTARHNNSVDNLAPSQRITNNLNDTDQDGPKFIINSSQPNAANQDLVDSNRLINSTTTTTTTTASSVQMPSSNESVPIGGEPATSGDSEEDDDANENPDEDSTNSDTTKETNHNDLKNNLMPFEPPQNISQYMDYIESLFHDLRHQISDLFEPHIPQLIRTSQMVELSSSCSYDMLRMALALRQFEPWALRMIDSSGKMPEGIFEGSFTALGSYDECINTVFQTDSSPLHTPSASSTPSSSSSSSSSSTSSSSSSGNNNNQGDQGKQGPTQGKYCLVTLSPFMPPKPPADKVERMFQEEANRRNYTKDNQFSRLSPMFYYMKFRIGVCIPSTCDEADMNSISSTLSSSLRLNITIPDCRVKQTHKALTQAQFIGGLVFACVVAIVLCATLADLVKIKLKRIYKQEMKLKHHVEANQHHKSRTTTITPIGKVSGGTSDNIAIRMRLPTPHLIGLHHQRQAAKFANASDEVEPARTRIAPNFQQELRTNWAWMSFSLLTNFRLYFKQKSTNKINSRQDNKSQPAPPPPPPSASLVHSSTNSKRHHEVNSGHMQYSQIHFQLPATAQISTINCLNGIRVLSLCWVILANSYLTLDPRATKRLTKSREAPRDFFFQIVVQASLAIETFFFLSGLLMSLGFAKKLMSSSSSSSNNTDNNDKSKSDHKSSTILKWLLFYVHRYIRMTPPTMLVIAFSMFAYHFGDGPLWFEATQRVHESCAQNWWRHLLHVANFIDTRQMCFIHYWYIAADMQLFLFAPVIMLLLYKCRRFGYAVIAIIGSISIGMVFYKTYERNLPPTLLFYNTDPESRREFGNTIMTKPFTHALPYLVGMLVGWFLLNSNTSRPPPPPSSSSSSSAAAAEAATTKTDRSPKLPIETDGGGAMISLTGLGGLVAMVVALAELFLPYKWNNSHLPSKLMASTYAALFRFGWSLVLAYIVLSCRHKRGRRCTKTNNIVTNYSHGAPALAKQQAASDCCKHCTASKCAGSRNEETVYIIDNNDTNATYEQCYCFCALGGNYMNRLLSLNIFSHLSKLSFVAYLIHLPLMSVFIGQTRGLFAFSHTLVIHFAISYLVMTFVLAFILVHIIEFPFLTFERHLFDKLLTKQHDRDTHHRANECIQKTSATLVPPSLSSPLSLIKHHSQPDNSGDTQTSSHRPRYLMTHHNESSDHEMSASNSSTSEHKSSQLQASDNFTMNDLHLNVAFGNDSSSGGTDMGISNRCQRRPNVLDKADLSDMHVSERL